jgi:hypothetical protein
MPITYFEGIKRSCNYWDTIPWFYEGKGDGWWLATTVYDSPTGPFQFQHLKLFRKFAFVRSLRGSKKKLLGRSQQEKTNFPDVSPPFQLFLHKIS